MDGGARGLCVGVGDAEVSAGPAAVQEAVARGDADGGGGEGVGEVGPLLGELVQIGGLQQGVAIDAEAVLSVLVSYDHEDVRLLHGRRFSAWEGRRSLPGR